MVSRTGGAGRSGGRRKGQGGGEGRKEGGRGTRTVQRPCTAGNKDLALPATRTLPCILVVVVVVWWCSLPRHTQWAAWAQLLALTWQSAHLSGDCSMMMPVCCEPCESFCECISVRILPRLPSGLWLNSMHHPLATFSDVLKRQNSDMP